MACATVHLASLQAVLRRAACAASAGHYLLALTLGLDGARRCMLADLPSCPRSVKNIPAVRVNALHIFRVGNFFYTAPIHMQAFTCYECFYMQLVFSLRPVLHT